MDGPLLRAPIARRALRRGVMLVAPVCGCQLVLPLHESSDASPGDGGALADSPETTSACGDPARTYPDEVMADEPALYLRLGEASGPTALDETGNFTGTYPPAGVVYGASGALAGDTNTAVTFDGTQGIAMPPGLDFAQASPFTVEVWARPTEYAPQGFALDHEDWRQGLPGRTGWDLVLSANGLGLERYDAGTSNGVASPDSALPLGTYHHVVATFDGSWLRTYIDGQRVALAHAPLNMGATGLGWTIGALNCTCSPNGFIGSLDEIAVYSKVLPEARIAEHYCIATKR